VHKFLSYLFNKEFDLARQFISNDASGAFSTMAKLEPIDESFMAKLSEMGRRWLDSCSAIAELDGVRLSDANQVMQIKLLECSVITEIVLDRDRFPAVQFAGRGGIGAEIGVWRGYHASQLNFLLKPATLFLIDPWKHREDGDYSQSAYGRIGSQDRMDEIYQSVLDRFKTNINRQQTIVERCSLANAMSIIPAHSLDWIYIDGDHTHDGTLTDLTNAMELLRPGGTILGDDYGTKGWWNFGVTTAVDSLLATHNNCKMLFSDKRTSQFAIRMG